MMSPMLVFIFDSPDPKVRQKIFSELLFLWIYSLVILADNFVFTYVNLDISFIPYIKRMHPKLVCNLAITLAFGGYL